MSIILLREKSKLCSSMYSVNEFVFKTLYFSFIFFSLLPSLPLSLHLCLSTHFYPGPSVGQALSQALGYSSGHILCAIDLCSYEKGQIKKRGEHMGCQMVMHPMERKKSWGHG
jgi:hypothetical protein